MVKLSEEKIEITLPEHWVESANSPERTNMGNLHTFVVANISVPRICYFRRRSPISAECAADFATVLAEPAHALSELELRKLNLVYFPAGRKELFEKFRCETIDLSGRRVLLLEGLWKEQGDFDYSVYFNYSLWVHVLFYSAKPDVYQDFLPEAKKAFETVEWKKVED